MEIPTGRQFTALCAPAKPDFIVGFDEPFNKSKIDLLREGSSILVLTGMVGFGKITLARKLCWDKQVLGKFRENILSLDLKLIVQELFQHCGYKKPMFLDNEDASVGLERLLQRIGKSPTMLMLDDVWPGSDSESLVKRLQMLSSSAILVTSGVKYSRFGTACHLKPLGYKDAEELSITTLIKMTAIHTFLMIILSKRKNACDADNYYNNLFITQHDLLRELASYQISQVPFEQRKRVIIDINGINNQWCVKEKQQGIIAHILSSFPKRSLKQKQHNSIALVLSLLPKWCVKQTHEGVISCLVKSLLAKWCFQPMQQQVIARTLSMPTDETLSSDFFNMQTAEVEVLILNLRTTQYFLPELMEKMSKLKVLIVTNHGIFPSELKNFEIPGSLSNLKRIGLEKILIHFLCKLMNLQKPSLCMCNTMKAFSCCTIQISDALPNLLEMKIDYCNDLVKLPVGFCDITSLIKLSITNCHKLCTLPSDIGKLENWKT